MKVCINKCSSGNKHCSFQQERYNRMNNFSKLVNLSFSIDLIVTVLLRQMTKYECRRFWRNHLSLSIKNQFNVVLESSENRMDCSNSMLECQRKCFHRETQGAYEGRNKSRPRIQKKKSTPFLINSGLPFSFVIKYFDRYFQCLSHILSSDSVFH